MKLSRKRPGKPSRHRRPESNGGSAPAGKAADLLLDPWRAFLAKHHLKLSRAREEVVETFLVMKGHVDLDELHVEVRKRNPTIGLATVYRAIKLMEEAGIAEARHFTDRNVSYEIAVGREHHDHLICENCGLIVEFADDEVERIQEETASAHGFVLLRHRHELFGVCPDCRPRADDA